MTKTYTIAELKQRSDAGIFAVPYRRGRQLGAMRILDGTIVETPLPAQRAQAPEFPAVCLELAIGGKVATIHHIQLGLVDSFLLYEGVFLLPSGEVAAVYGAEAVPLG